MRAWKPFNGLQLYDPEAWQDQVEDLSVFDSPPEMCKKGSRAVRLHCDDEGNYHPEAHANNELLEAFLRRRARAVSRLFERFFMGFLFFPWRKWRFWRCVGLSS